MKGKRIRWTGLVVLLLLAACVHEGENGSVPVDNANDNESTLDGKPSVAAKTSVIDPGDVDCPAGGILVETGIDENGNGVLDTGEVDATEKVCNGGPGPAGSDGSDGFNALVSLEDEPAAANCTNGGKRIRSGLDINGNGVLDVDEVTSDAYLCNGEPGAQGPAGEDGLSALIDMNPEPVGVNCPMAGLRIDVGNDLNRNGSLDSDEITQTGFVCNGGDGSIGWQVPSLLEFSSAGDAGAPRVVVDTNGNATAVWRQSDGTRYNLWANRYVPGTGWGEAQLIETDDAGSAWLADVAVDASGTVVAVWYQFDGTRYNVWANHYVPGFGWSMAEVIENASGSATDPQVAVDDSGNAVAVWSQVDGGVYSIYANRYVSGTGWGTAQLIETDDSGDARYPQVAMDDNGNAVVVWQQSDGTRYNIWSNRYVQGTGWGTAQLIETDNAGDAYVPQVAVDGSGNAVAVWYQFDGSNYHIRANRFVPDTGWGSVELIETDDAANALDPQVAMDTGGNAVVVWRQSDGTRYNIWSNRYVPGAGWGTAELIETDNNPNVRPPQIAMNGDGQVVAVWDRYGRAWFNRYVPGLGWGTAQRIETGADGSVAYPRVALDSNGNAVVVWEENDGTRSNIWSNRWQAP